MNIVAHNHQSRELLSSKISHFLEEFHVGGYSNGSKKN